LVDLIDPVCPRSVYKDYLLTEVCKDRTDRTEEEMMDFVVDLLVNRINVNNERYCVNVDTLLFLAEVFKIVGENFATTQITMEKTAELIARNIFHH
jgi:hypothetical protein